MRETIAQLAALCINWPDFWFIVVLAFGARFFGLPVEVYVPNWLSKNV